MMQFDGIQTYELFLKFAFYPIILCKQGKQAMLARLSIWELKGFWVEFCIASVTG